MEIRHDDCSSTTGKSGAAVQAIFAVRPLHGNDAFAVRGKEDARQSRGTRQTMPLQFCGLSDFQFIYWEIL